MIDLHTHILPGIDDGAETMAEAVATPHANFRYQYHPEKVRAGISALEEASGGAVRIHRGCEVHFSAANILDIFAAPEKYAVNGGGYILVEFPDWVIPATVESVFVQLRKRKVTPIIAHPERNAMLRSQPERVKACVDAGCRLQLTAQSVTGRFGRAAERFCHQLMSVKQAHFVASDAHDPTHRPPILAEAFAAVTREHGPEMADALFVRNPAAVLAGEPLQ